MSDQDSTAPIVVGVDGSPTSHGALEWAIAEANAAGSPLHVVHVLDASRTGPAAELARAALHAQTAAPALRIISTAVVGAAAPALLRHAEGAQLLVVGTPRRHEGRHGFGTLPPRSAASVSLTLAAHAACPVVVVPPEQVERSPRPGAGEPSPGQVVVASDGSELSAAAVRFAFQAAARRRSDLIVICAWTPPFAGYQRIVLGLHQLVRAELHAVYETLTPHRLEFPEVEVEVKLVRRKDSHHGRALVDESATAALIVLGSHERRSLAGWFSDGFVPSVLEHARCPVAVVGAAMTASPTLAPDAANPELLHLSAAPSIDVGRGDVNEVLRWLDST